MADQPLIDISPENWRIVRDILQRYVPDREVWAFGSRAKWTAKEFSDLDIAIIGEEPMSISLMADMREAFQESALPFKIDIVDWAAITPSFRKVAQSGKVLLQKKANRAVSPEPTFEHRGGDWASMSLGDVITLKRGHDLPSQSRIKGTVPIVSSSGVSDFHAVAKVKGPAVITGRYGTIGQVFYSEEDCWPLNTTLYVEDFKGNDPKFVYYLLKTIDYQKYNDKAAVPGINRNHLHTAVVSVPDLATQREIANTLSSFDDRITLLRDTNTTLEAIAQALFKSWFVDFDPVRAKAEGREFEGVPPEVAGLFPSEFEDGYLGKVPIGWGVQRVEDFASKVGMGPFGSNIKVSTFVSSGVPVINGQQLRGTLLEDASNNFISAEHAERLSSSIVSRGDLVFTHRGNIGQVSIIPNDCMYPQYVASQSQFYLRCDRDRMLPNWAIYFFRSPLGQHLLLANASQVGVPSIARPASYLKSIRLVVPPMPLMRLFEEAVEVIHAKQMANMHEITSLSGVRDAVLPRMLSGKLKPVEIDS